MSRQALAAIVAGIVAVWLIVRRRGEPGSLSIDLSGLDLSALIGPPQPSGRVAQLAQAIARAEGFYAAGSVPAATNNPGDLKLPNTRTTPGGISIFESIDQGWAALYRQLDLIAAGRSAFYSLDMTIRQMGNTWAPAADRNLPGAWAQNVARALGVSVDTPLRQVLT